MKTLGSFIDRKKLTSATLVDEKSVFYVFNLLIKEEYGRQGAERIIPAFLKGRKIYVRVTGPNWESEISLNKKQITAKLNRELGGDEILDLVIAP